MNGITGSSPYGQQQPSSGSGTRTSSRHGHGLPSSQRYSSPPGTSIHHKLPAIFSSFPLSPFLSLYLTHTNLPIAFFFFSLIFTLSYIFHDRS